MNKNHIKVLLPIIFSGLVLFACSSSKSTSMNEASLHEQKIEQADLNNLFDAIRDGNSLAVRQRLSRGMNLNVHSELGLTPLSLAASKGNTEIVALLLNDGADISFLNENEYRTCSLIEAARGGHYNTVKLLLVQGADVNQRDKFGDPALNWATYYGQLEVVQLLIEHGAELTLVGSGGGTALGTAIQQHHEDIEQVLRKAGATK